ncbi:unnamed protein product [Effrenium voratum]|uniref:Uncharacterized protein n=1 Tax=Effrenium voratum TaxID=2562239 RepID=A0AA36JLW5_9DINO|nr:unnamed protein product [Effrenium voratum]CAJ1425023.1 unnamed protein product [Effrenium voratum]
MVEPMDVPSRGMFRPSRTLYPGSRFGPKTRYDLPQRHKAYGNGSELEAIIFNGTSLQPEVWGSHGDRAVPKLDISAGRGNGGRADRDGQAVDKPHVLADTGRSLLTDRNLPELPLINDRNDVHGIAVLGGKSAGKTSLICSLLAVQHGKYPHSHENREKLREMPAYGNSWDLPEREIRYLSGETRQMRVVLTDTPSCGTTREEQPLCSSISPNSVLHYSAVPSWMRIILRSGNLPHYAVLFLIDATAPAVWEDHQRGRELARLLAVLKRSQYTVVLGVTKLLKLREDRLKETAYGAEHNGEVGKDPRSSYESFASRYIDKVCACIQAKAGENDWSFSDSPEAVSFPLPNVSIFDVPTWTSITDHQAWQGRKGTPELPNFKYFNAQLMRLLLALCKRSSSEAA